MRESLPHRRANETFKVEWGEPARPYSILVTVGYYPDGRAAEVFVAGTKTGEGWDLMAREAAILLSLALQHGVPLDTIMHAISRDFDGKPTTMIGALVDQLKEKT